MGKALAATSAATPPATVAALAESLHEVDGDPGLKATRAELLIDGFDCLAPGAYQKVAEIERAAAARGYRELR